MKDTESNTEVLELAISREEDANRFYRILATKAKDPAMRKVLEGLADEELTHKATLELEMMKLGYVVQPLARENDDEDDDFRDKPEIEMSYADMLVMAIEKEEASYRLYVDLIGRVTNEAWRETLMALAEQEVKHKIRFELEYDNLTSSSNGEGEPASGR